MAGDPAFCEAAGQMAGDRPGGAAAGIDDKQGLHETRNKPADGAGASSEKREQVTKK
jgi:hypothetical protein